MTTKNISVFQFWVKYNISHYIIFFDIGKSSFVTKKKEKLPQHKKLTKTQFFQKKTPPPTPSPPDRSTQSDHTAIQFRCKRSDFVIASVLVWVPRSVGQWLTTKRKPVSCLADKRSCHCDPRERGPCHCRYCLLLRQLTSSLPSLCSATFVRRRLSFLLFCSAVYFYLRSGAWPAVTAFYGLWMIFFFFEKINVYIDKFALLLFF